MLDMILIFLIYQSLPCGPACGQSWRMLHDRLRRLCILLLLDGMLYKYQLSPTHLKCHLRPVFPYWFYFWIICPLKKVVKSPTIVLLSILSFMFIGIYLTYWGAPILGAYIYLQLLYLIFGFIPWSLCSVLLCLLCLCLKVYHVMCILL